MRRLLLSLFVCLALAPALGATARADMRLQRRKLVEPRYDHKTLNERLGVKSRGGMVDMWSGSGATLERNTSKPQATGHYEAYQEALSRLVDLDPRQELLSKAEWAHVLEQHKFDLHQVRNTAENLEFVLKDPALRIKQTRALVEKVRGKLASVLVTALRGKRPDPETLAQVTESLSKKFPFFGNAFHSELLIADVRGLAPQLARWDFGRPTTGPGSGTLKLPPKIQRVVRDLGQRVFADANVLLVDHAYTDAHVTLDAMRAMGLDVANARFVTTEYPFDADVRAGIEARGVPVAHAPYDRAATRLAVEQAVGALIAKSAQNHNPILVLDDGGMAAAVIAEKYPSELHRFRMVEITKAGERVAKATLPKALGIDYKRLRSLNPAQLGEVKERFLVANSSDAATRTVAEERWKQIASYLRLPSMERVEPQNSLPQHAFGFAHYTYSDSRYKREVMTPLYTQAVNKATFEVIAHQGNQLTNKKVTIIGGGAMGLNAGLELRAKDFEVTFVEPDATRRTSLVEEHGFSVSELKPALKGRGLILELSGMHKLISAEHLFLIDDGAHVVHGSSKDNPFDMDTIKALASETIAWKPSPTGQSSASYVFEAGGRRRTLHFPGNGYTISHGGKQQNVPLKKFLPEVEALLRLSAHALHNDRTISHFPFFGTPEWLTKPGMQRKALREPALSLQLQPRTER